MIKLLINDGNLNINQKDDLTDIASQISNQPSSQQLALQSQNNSGNNQPQNLASNRMVGLDGIVIDLGRIINSRHNLPINFLELQS